MADDPGAHLGVAEREGRAKAGAKFNIGQYRGIFDQVAGVKDLFDSERTKAAAKERELQELMRESQFEAGKVQKELSVQLRCAGRSYQSLLAANRELADQLRHEEKRRVDEVEDLQAQLKEAKGKIMDNSKPWREEVQKRELKNMKLQEANNELKERIHNEMAKIPPLHAEYKEQIRLKEEALETVLREISALREQNEEQAGEHQKALKEQKKDAAVEAAKWKQENRETAKASKEAEKKAARTIKDLERKITELQKQLAAVDHTPYENKIEAQKDGYARLLKDFELKSRANLDSVQQMRDNFEDVLQKLDTRINENEIEFERRLKPFHENIANKEGKIGHLEHKISEMKEYESEMRKKQMDIEKTMRKELQAAKEAVEIQQQETYALKRQYEQILEENEGDNGPKKRMKALERRCADVVEKCGEIIRIKDHDITEKAALVSRLQAHQIEEKRHMEEFSKEWDRRVQEKEAGYALVVAQLKFAESQIVAERKRTQAALEQVRAREQDIARLKAQHNEELRCRAAEREELVQTISELEATVDSEARRFEVMFSTKVAEHDAFRRRDEERVADLRMEIARRERQNAELQNQLGTVRSEFEQARSAWDDKARELEVNIRDRDRMIAALKNEQEFLNDSWEIKYQRINGLFEKLQQKYNDIVGSNGASEAHRRARDLKAENSELMQKIGELNETIAKQKKRIRGLELDIDGLMKETADIIEEKERGIAEMAADYVKLENKYRALEELKKQLLRQKDAERMALAESFQARVDQLEQLMEAMRFNDRDEMLAKIAMWRKNYERVNTAKEEEEEMHNELIRRKDVQVKTLLEEVDELTRQWDLEKDNTKARVKEVEEAWKTKQVGWNLEKEVLENKIREVEIDLRKALKDAERERIMNGALIEDPEKQLLRDEIEKLKAQMGQIEAGTRSIIEENTTLRGENLDVNSMIQDVHDEYKPQLLYRDKIIQDMQGQHDDLKEILKAEMQRAQDTCRSLQEQVKLFPMPFQEELKEMRDKYAQMQTGMQQLQLENVFLRERIEEERKLADADVEGLEQNLHLAAMLLKEVSSLGFLKSMGKGNLAKLEGALGVDLDGDGRIAK